MGHVCGAEAEMSYVIGVCELFTDFRASFRAKRRSRGWPARSRGCWTLCAWPSSAARCSR